MELTVKDLLKAISVKPFGDEKDITVEIIGEDGTTEVCYGKEYTMAEYGDLLVTTSGIHGHLLTIFVKGVM